MKLLIVDDSAAMRRIITELLPEEDKKLECRNGKEAIAAFVAHQPDWVLMDIQMNGVDGLSAAEAIKAEHPEARIIFVTAYDEPRYRAAAMKLGANGYVLKDRLDEINAIIAAYEGKANP